MTSSFQDNRCKLLVLDLDIDKISVDYLRTYFSSYGSIEWIETFPRSKSAIIYFTNHLTIDHLISNHTCINGQNTVRLRRCRLDQNNWHIDSQTLLIKLISSNHSNNLLTESILSYCFQDYQSHIVKIDIIDEYQALISFSNYDYVDQIILMSSKTIIYDGMTFVFERILERPKRQSRWDQVAAPLSTQPILAVRDPVVYKLLTHIEYLTKQIREQPNQYRNKIEQLEAEVFILKNENARLKSKSELSSHKNFEKRLSVLEDISNQFVNKRTSYNRRERSNSNEKQTKRQRQYKINDELVNAS